MFISGLAILGLSPVIAQRAVIKDNPQKSRVHSKQDHYKLNAEQKATIRVKRLDKAVSLSPDQQASIKAIYLSDVQKRADQKMETQKKVEALLTAEQKMKFQSAKEERIEAMKARKTERGPLKKAPGIKPAAK